MEATNPLIRNLEEAINENLAANDQELLDDCESLALSDEKSICDSFTSLDVEDVSTGQGAIALIEQTNQTRSLHNLDVQQLGTSTAAFRRQTWETRSMTNLERIPRETDSDKLDISVGGWTDSRSVAPQANNKGSFVRKRDLWEKRASITQPSQLNLRQKHTPDLVMDLPPSLPLSSSPKEDGQDVSQRQRHESDSSSSSSSSNSSSSPSPNSPEMTTAAETFAMQNQSTLKKSAIKQAKKDDMTSFAATAHQVHEVEGSSSRLNRSESTSSVKLHIAAFSPANNGNVQTTPAITKPQTPKVGNRFPHLYGTPMPVLPIAFASSNQPGSSGGIDTSSLEANKPQVRTKPQVLKKPTLPSMNSPEASRRSTVNQD